MTRVAELTKWLKVRNEFLLRMDDFFKSIFVWKMKLNTWSQERACIKKFNWTLHSSKSFSNVATGWYYKDTVHCSSCPLACTRLVWLTLSVYFPLTIAINKAQQHQKKLSEMPRIKTGAAGWAQRMLPLYYAAPHSLSFFMHQSADFSFYMVFDSDSIL